MTPAQALGVAALRVFAWGLPLALAYLAAAQFRCHHGSAIALGALALALAAWSAATGGLAAGAAVSQGGYVAAAAVATLAVLAWKLRLRPPPGFRDHESVLERLLPILIVADLLFLLLSWPAVAEWRAGLIGR